MKIGKPTLLAAILMVSTGLLSPPVSVFAQSDTRRPTEELHRHRHRHHWRVPELDPGLAVSAIAILGAGVLLISERRRRSI